MNRETNGHSYVGTRIKNANSDSTGATNGHVEVAYMTPIPQTDDTHVYTVFFRPQFERTTGPSPLSHAAEYELMSRHRHTKRGWDGCEVLGERMTYDEAVSRALEKAEETGLPVYLNNRQSSEGSEILWHPEGWQPTYEMQTPQRRFVLDALESHTDGTL